jgi:ketosteroid isomerase-like protein
MLNIFEKHLSPPRWRIILALTSLFCIILCHRVAGQRPSGTAKDRAAILQIMADQETAWNNGDLEGFMAGYWQDDSLRFIGKSGITYGWKATLANYQKGYPDKAAMGKLTFTILRVERLGRHERAQDEPQGYFTLLWRKVDGKWVIVADHSS